MMDVVMVLTNLLMKLLWLYMGLMALVFFIIALSSTIGLLLVVNWYAGVRQQRQRDEHLGEGKGADQRRPGEGD